MNPPQFAADGFLAALLPRLGQTLLVLQRPVVEGLRRPVVE
jgi:hypothetical protein